ncbi:MAG: M28 family peptidase, partial [Actinoplanes sp.]
MRAPALVDTPHRALAALIAVVVLALTGYAAVLAVQPPAMRDPSAPAGEFSAGRAFEHVQAIAIQPHPVGSAAQDAVREHLLTTLRGMGLTPEVQDTVSVEGGALSSSAGGTGLARVRNVVTVIPGTASTGRVFLVAHYDSAQVAPGGNDDAAGTSAILETARALLTGPRPRNDIVLVLTDGEEACLCGAKAFVDQHPLARDGGVVLNLEARGSSGPAIMFETTEKNRRLIDVYASAPHPVGTSFAVEIYRLLPNDTDFTPFREAGRFTGMNSAYIDGAAVYHAPTDLPASMDRDSLQHHGDNNL